MCSNNLDNRIRIVDEDFVINIYRLNSFTIKILNDYVDWKCNDGKKINKFTNKIGRPSISKEVEEEIIRLHDLGKTNDVIIHAIDKKFGMVLHRNTITRYKLKKNQS